MMRNRASVVRPSGRISRIARLEGAALSRTVGRFFVVWGADAADVRSAVATALGGGLIGRDSPLLALVWPHDPPLPPCRWVTSRHLSDAEERAIIRWVGVTDECGGSVEAYAYDRGRAAELSDDELMEIIVQGSRPATEQIIRSAIH
jgi:hypothetical protein